jgi:hypothetical protein
MVIHDEYPMGLGEVLSKVLAFYENDANSIEVVDNSVLKLFFSPLFLALA